MARRNRGRRVRRPVERGWNTIFTETVLEHTDVDNVVTQLDKMYAFSDLVDQTEDIVLGGQDRVADYYIEAIKGFVQHTATLAVGNTLGTVPVWWGFLIGDEDVLDSVPTEFTQLQLSQFWSEAWRGNEHVRQVMRVNIDLTFANYFPGEGLYPNARMTPWFIPVELPTIHLKRGEALYFVTSQTGATVEGFQPWVGADAVASDGVFNCLIRKKRAHS